MAQKESIELIKLRKRIIMRFHKACAGYGLIEDGDKILIGLSGGKDSLALTELLGRRQQIHVPRFSVVAVHVIVENIGYQSDTAYLQRFCEEQGVPFFVRNTSYDSPSLTDSPAQKTPCFLCSWYRRKALFDAAKEFGCNKLALGHHKDDIVETLLLNLIYQGAFATNPPLLKMEKFPLTLIRPLCLIKEAEIRQYAELRGYRQMPKLCPFEHDSSRAGIKQLLHSLSQLNPEVLDSIWGAMENVKTEYLPRTK